MEENQEPKDVREKTIREISITQFNIIRRISQIVMILGFAICVPIITPEYGATPEQVREFLKVAIPVTLVSVPVAIYKLHHLKVKKKKLVEKLIELDSELNSAE